MTIPPPQNLHGATAEDLYDDRLVAEARVFDPTLGPPSEEEYQYASFLSKLGGRARDWKIYERHNNIGKNQRSLGRAWERLQEKLETQRQLETTLEEATVETTTSTGVTTEKVVPKPRYSVGETTDGKHQVLDAGVAGDPVVVREFDTETGATALFRELQHGPRPKTGPSAREEPEAPEVAEHEFEQAAEQPAAAEEAARATAGKMDDAYGSWMTFGDEALDEITAAVMRRPEIRGGLIGGDRGVRVEGTAPGMETKVVDEGSVYNIIEGVAKAIEAELKTRGIDEIKVISHEQTSQMRDIIGGNPKGLARELLGGKLEVDLTNPGSFGAKMAAAKDLLIGEIKILDELTKKGLAERSDSARFEWWRQAQLVGNLERAYLGAKTEMGRTLNAFKIPATNDALVIGQAYHEVIEGVGGANQIDAAMARYLALPPGPKRAGYIKGTTLFAKLTDANHEVWINWILSNPWTQVKNVAGTASIVVLNLGEMGVTAARQAPYALVGRQPDVTFGDIRAHTFGLYMSMSEGFSAAGRGFWLREDPIVGAEMSIYDRNIGQNTLGNARRDPFSAEGFEATNFKRTIDFLGNLATGGRLPIRMLQGGDAFWKTLTYRASLYEQAYRQARLDGKYGEEFSEFIADFIFHPPAAAAEQAADFANYATLQSRMEGWLRNLQQAFGNRLFRIVVPFFKTPTNNMIYWGERGPFAPFYARWRAAMAQGGSQAAQAKTRWAVGSSVMLLLAFEYESGSFTGSLSSDPYIREAYRRMGITPYSVRDVDEYYSYRDFEPVMTIVGFIGDVMEVIGHPDMEDADAIEVAGGAVMSIGDNLLNKTFMSGLSVFIDAMKSEGGAKRMITQYRRSYSPMSSGLNQARKWIDPIKRLHAGLKEEYMSRLPGLSEDLTAARDLWGRPITETFIVSPYRPNPVDEELIRLGLRFPRRHAYQIDGVGLMTENASGDNEVDIYHKLAGELSFQMLSDLMDPKTELGAEYAKFKKASEGGNDLARDNCRLLMRRELQRAQALAQYEFLNSPAGKTVSEKILERHQLIEQQNLMFMDTLQQPAQ